MKKYEIPAGAEHVLTGPFCAFNLALQQMSNDTPDAARGALFGIKLRLFALGSYLLSLEAKRIVLDDPERPFLSHMDADDLTGLMLAAEFMFQPENFNASPEPRACVVDGREYECFHALERITMAQKLDMDAELKQIQTSDEMRWRRLPNLLAYCLVDKGLSYQDALANVAQRRADMFLLSYLDAQATLAFFLRRTKPLSADGLASLAAMMKEMSRNRMTRMVFSPPRSARPTVFGRMFGRLQKTARRTSPQFCKSR